MFKNYGFGYCVILEILTVSFLLTILHFTNYTSQCDDPVENLV